MQTSDEIKQFFKLLLESGLDEDRISFWLSKFEKGDVTEEDQQAFNDELNEHMTDTDNAVIATEDEIKGNADELEKAEQDAIPYLHHLSAGQNEYYESREKEYKKTILEEEKLVTGKIEKIRSGKQTAEMEKIRKMLKS